MKHVWFGILWAVFFSIFYSGIDWAFRWIHRDKSRG